MNQQNNPQVLGTESIGKLLFQYSIPAIIGMMIVSLYHIIDSIFIGHGVGPLAISGLAITFPLMNLVVAFNTLVGSGGSTISSIRLGQKDLKGATDVLGNTFMVCIINSILCGGVSLIFLDEILFFFGASEATLPYARDFMTIILIGSPVAYVMISLNNVMRATGYPKKAMLSSMLSVLCNVALAPLFIFVFDWGIKGAAWATVVSQSIALVWVIHHFLNKESTVHFTKDFWRMNLRIILSIFSIGMAPFLMNVCTCVIVIVINNTLKSHGGDLAIGAYGIINRLLTLYVMIVLGLTMGMQPISGYNYGAGKMSRVHRTLKLGIISGVVITSSGFLLSEFLPRAISSMFTDSEELINIASSGLRIAALMFPLVGSQIVISNFFQSIGKVKISIFLSLSRQMVYLLPALLILPGHYGINGVWASMPVSDLLAFITAWIALFLYFRSVKKDKSIEQMHV